VAYNDMLANVQLQPGARINGVTVQRMAGKRDGRELYIGVASDPLFGPVIGFGAGGTMIELLNDRAVELPPLNQFLAQRLVARAAWPTRWANGAARRRWTCRPSKTCCCAYRKWCANCRSCASWISTR
jgi:hypothetical protein